MRRQQFTLMELAVLLVIGIMLASLLVPAVMRLGERRNVVNCQQSLQLIGIATRDHAADNDGYLPMARGPEGWWFAAMPAELSLRCQANPGAGEADEQVNFGWNSYLGDVDLAAAATPVRLASISRPETILNAGDGTLTGGLVDGGAPAVWLQKTWHREAQQLVLGPATHGDGMNYLFMDGHVEAIDLMDPRLSSNPVLLPERNFWVERVVSVPGPFFR